MPKKRVTKRQLPRSSTYFVGQPIDDPVLPDDFYAGQTMKLRHWETEQPIGMEFGHDDVVGMRLMWRAFLDRMVDDLRIFDPEGDEPLIIESATSWYRGLRFYDATSSGFIATCDLAGFEPGWVRDRMDKIFAGTLDPAPILETADA